MHPIGVDAHREFGVGGNQQHQPPRMANFGETPGDPFPVRRPEMPVNHAKPPWQAGSDGFRLRRPGRVGHKQGRGQVGGPPPRKCVRTGARSGDQLAPRPALGF